MTQTIFKVASFEELYHKLFSLYANATNAEDLIHNMSYIDLNENKKQITDLIKRYKKISYEKELINIEFYCKNHRFTLRINYKQYENNKWIKTNCYTTDIWTIGYRSEKIYKDWNIEWILEDRIRFKVHGDKKDFLKTYLYNDDIKYYKDEIKTQIRVLEGMIDLLTDE